MSIERLRLYRYRLALRHSMVLKGISLHAREGLLLEITGEDGQPDYGEIVPLPGFSRESIEEAQAQTIALLERCQGGRALDALPEVTGNPEAWHRLAHSVRCGLSMALQNHWAREEGTALYQFLCPFPRKSLPVAALLTGDEAELRTQAEALAGKNLAAAKIKVGRLPIEVETVRVRAVADILGGNCSLRIDANQAWDLETALAFAEGVQDLPIAFIEEPLARPGELLEYARRSVVPFAVDESVAPVLGLHFDVVSGRMPAPALEKYGWPGTEPITELLQNAAAIVVKPTLAGEFGRLVYMAKASADSGIQWVTSAACESGVGIAALAQLAGCLNEDDLPAGLGTYHALLEDVLAAPLPLEFPRANLAGIHHAAASVATARLEQVWPV